LKEYLKKNKQFFIKLSSILANLKDAAWDGT
jgi:hypothetical protein